MNTGRRQSVIVGAGVAAVEAAAALRTRNSSSRILLIGEEPYPFYARIRLAEVVAGRSEPDRLVLRNPDWYRQRDIEFIPRKRVEAISIAEARVHVASGEWIPYDQLLLATGARPFVPPIPGAGLDGVVTLRTMEDAVRLRERARSDRSAVVIGGGLLGLEAAATLRALGLAVTVIETAPYLLPRQLDPAGAEVVLKTFLTRGIDFRFGASVEAIVGTDRVQAVRLSRGANREFSEECVADLVLIAAGVRPEVSLAREAGIVVDRGIVVDDRMTTSVPGIFAAGDCAEHRGRVYGIWPASEAQGRIAGAAMAGDEVRYAGTIPSATLKVADLPVFSAGDVDPQGARESEVLIEGHRYRKLVRDQAGRLVGAILIGDLTERRALQAALERESAIPNKT